MNESNRVAGHAATAREHIVRCRGGQELTVVILLGIFSRLCEWVLRVAGRRFRDEALVPRERNGVVLVVLRAAPPARIVCVLMIPQLVRVVHEVLRVAEGALRHVLWLVRRFAAGVVGLGAPLAIDLGARRPLLHLLVMALPAHLLYLQVFNVSLEIGATAAAAHE